MPNWLSLVPSKVFKSALILARSASKFPLLDVWALVARRLVASSVVLIVCVSMMGIIFYQVIPNILWHSGWKRRFAVWSGGIRRYKTLQFIRSARSSRTRNWRECGSGRRAHHHGTGLSDRPDLTCRRGSGLTGRCDRSGRFGCGWPNGAWRWWLPSEVIRWHPKFHINCRRRSCQTEGKIFSRISGIHSLTLLQSIHTLRYVNQSVLRG